MGLAGVTTAVESAAARRGPADASGANAPGRSVAIWTPETAEIAAQAPGERWLPGDHSPRARGQLDGVAGEPGAQPGRDPGEEVQRRDGNHQGGHGERAARPDRG
jgi:hypothetical protein